MKKTVYLILILFGVFAVSCNSVKEKTAEELLNDPAMEENIYSAITASNMRISKIVNKILGNENSKAILMRNNSLIKNVCMSPNLDSIIEKDQQVLQNLSNIIMPKMEADSFACDHTCTKSVELDFINKYSKRKHKTNK
ncbi:MAG: hypothetical protein Q8T03_06615 [Bacteroidota bacterium]|nr:hypothetical protein [Bacteroidota bacterium]